MENWKAVTRLFSLGDFLASIDLKDAYLLFQYIRSTESISVFVFKTKFINLRPCRLVSRQLLIFLQRFSSRFSLPLGREVSSLLMYLDNFLLITPSFRCCKENVTATVNLLHSLGFLINKSKSNFVPTKSYRFLSLIFDSKEFAVSILAEKRRIFLERTISLLSLRECNIRFLASYEICK